MTAGTSPIKAGDLDPVTWGRFASWGWTLTDWDDLDDISTWDVVALAAADRVHPGAIVERHMDGVREWLRHPPHQEAHPISPGDVRAVFAQYGRRTPAVLTAYAAGASPRFVQVFLTRTPGGNPWAAWFSAQRAGLDEPAACGWAATGWLFTRVTGHPDGSDVREVATHLTPWVDRFGPTAYLFVLAGMDLDEAIALEDAGVLPDQTQLRVMAALAGVVLPPGI